MPIQEYHSIDSGEDGENSPLVKPSSSPPPPAIGSQTQAAAPTLPAAQGFYERRVQPCVVELFGTAVFVFVGSMTQQNELLLANAIGHGLTVALLILALGKLSGGHFNPAVSVAVMLAGGLDILMVAGYWLCQLSGAILGAAMARGCLSYQKQVVWLPASNGTVYEQIRGGAMTLQPGATIGAGLFTEFVISTLLVTVYLMACLDSRTQTPTAGLAVGFAVVVGMNAGGPVTKAAMNPARALGPAVLVTDFYPSVWDEHYIYWAGPLLGACAAVLLYRLFFAARDRRILFTKLQ